jgi:hypothetical protein
LIALAGSGPGAELFLVLASSMDGSDGPFEPPVAEETNPVLAPVILAYQIQNKPIRKYWVILIYICSKVQLNH